MNMTMEMKQLIEKIAGLKENDVGVTEENVKQKIIVPLLELLGHERKDLDFEYRTRSGKGKIDIFIRNVPKYCRVIIDTKNYSEDLDNHIEQIKEYTSEESPLLAVIANGAEIRIYSPLPGVDFERSLLYSIKRHHLAKKSVWLKLADLLHKESLQDGTANAKIEERKREIKKALIEEESLKQKYSDRVETVNRKIEAKQEKIERLGEEKSRLIDEQNAKLAKIWDSIELPIDVSRASMPFSHTAVSPFGVPSAFQPKAGRVNLQELKNAGLIRDGQFLYFYNRRLFKDEQVQIMTSSNRVKYRKNGRSYSVSELAKILLIKHGFKRDQHGVAGPRYWKTRDGKLLDDLNEEIRRKRGDRK